MGKLLQQRLVPDPSMSDSEFLYQQNRERDRARSIGVKPRTSIGKVIVEENAITRIGALAYIRRREQHHEFAAERFKSLYEARYGSGNPAMDASRIQVDSSPIAHDSGMAAKLDRTEAIKDAEVALGKDAFDRLVALLALEEPAGEGQGWRKRFASVDQVLRDLDALSVHWKGASRHVILAVPNAREVC